MKDQRSSLVGSLISVAIMASSVCFLSLFFPVQERPIMESMSKYSEKETDNEDDSDQYRENRNSDVLSSVINYYYYSLLDGENKRAYEMLLDTFRNYKGAITLNLDAAESEKIFNMVLYDHPELFWVSNDYSYSINILEETTTIQPEYSIEEKNIDSRQQEIDEFAQEVYDLIPEDATDYEKVEMVYDYLVDNIEYDLNAEDNQNIYSAMGENHATVCAGYAKTAEYLLQRLGMNCIFVTGEITIDGGGSHAWNIVKIENEWYEMDVTWGDMGTEDVGLPQNYYPNHAYLCVTDDEMLRSRTFDFSEELPECTSTQNNYYVINDRYADHYDKQTLEDSMQDVLLKATDAVWSFKFSNQSDYEKCYVDLSNGEYSEAIFGISDTRSSYGYLYDDEMYIVWVWLK